MSRRRDSRADDPSSRLLTREQCEALRDRLFSRLSYPRAALSIDSGFVTTTNFARGDAHIVTETASVRLSLGVGDGRGRGGASVINWVDDESLDGLVRDAESAAAALTPVSTASQSDEWTLGPQTYPPAPVQFFENVLPAMASDARANVFRASIDATDTADVIGAGDLNFELNTRALYNTKGLNAYERSTYGEFSLTARTKDGIGSGSAWSGYEDWSRVAVQDVIGRAVDLAHRTAKPVAVEPGRYTAILEPAAVAALVRAMTTIPYFTVYQADAGWTVYSKDPVGTNKIGLQMMDSRLNVVGDPWDPEHPSTVIYDDGTPLAKVNWFERGVLRNLAGAMYAPPGHQGALPPAGKRLFLDGPQQTLDEMIASTQRGIWVNRLDNVERVDDKTLLLTGTTRDGTFLIENGKITKAIKNFRFLESPFFVFNKLDAGSAPIRASRGVVAPRLKVRDFDFTSLTDAV